MKKEFGKIMMFNSNVILNKYSDKKEKGVKKFFRCYRLNMFETSNHYTAPTPAYQTPLNLATFPYLL